MICAARLCHRLPGALQRQTVGFSSIRSDQHPPSISYGVPHIQATGVLERQETSRVLKILTMLLYTLAIGRRLSVCMCILRRMVWNAWHSR